MQCQKVLQCTSALTPCSVMRDGGRMLKSLNQNGGLETRLEGTEVEAWLICPLVQDLVCALESSWLVGLFSRLVLDTCAQSLRLRLVPQTSSTHAAESVLLCSDFCISQFCRIFLSTWPSSEHVFGASPSSLHSCSSATLCA